MGYIEKTYGRSEKFLAFKVCFYDTLVPTREYKSGYAADRFARKCAAQGPSWWMPPTTSDTSGRAGRTVRLPTRSRRLPCSDGSNNGS